MDTHRIYEFDSFRLDVEQRLLLRDGQPVALKSKAFDLLVVLVENNNRLVEKEDLMRRLWPDSIVEENNLTVHKRALVAALGDRYIKTVPRHGYRFVADVREVSSSSDAVSQSDTVVSPSSTADKAETEVHHDFEPALVSQLPEISEPSTSKVLKSQTGILLASVIALIIMVGVAFVWQRIKSSASSTPAKRVHVRSPSDEAEVMRVVKESQIYETLKIYTHPESFDRRQLDKYWMSVEQGGKAVPAIEAAVKRLLERGWRYSDESRLDIFDFRYVRIFSPRDYAEVGTSERWYVPTVRADGSRVENRNVYLGVYDVDYTLRKIDGRWLIEENSTPRPKSGSNQNN